MDVEVLKFDGSIPKGFEDFERAAAIVVEKLKRPKLPLCIVSAMNGVSDEIIQAVNGAHLDSSFNPHSFVKNLYEEPVRSVQRTEHARDRGIPEGNRSHLRFHIRWRSWINGR